MHVRLPKPLHGWRAFFGEIVVIVIGVLIALGAEQLVETIHWSREVRQTRNALDAELAFDIAAFDHRVSQRPCVAARLAELKGALALQRQAQVAPFRHEITGPIGFGLRFGVWEAASGESRSRIPIDAKLEYAGLYDFLHEFRTLRLAEDADWDKLEDFDFASRLDRRDVQQAAGSIKRLENLNDLLLAYIPYRRELARSLHVEPDKAIDSTAREVMQANRRALCSPFA